MSWDIDPTALTFEGNTVRYFALLMLLSAVFGYALLRWQIRRGGGAAQEAGELAIYAFLGAMFGARLGFVFTYGWEATRERPLSALEIWNGGLFGHGALVGLLVALSLFARRRRMPLLEVTDRLTFTAALAGVLMRIGSLFVSEGIGRITDVPWAMRFPRYETRAWDVPLRHPAPLYESCVALVALGILFALDRQGEKQRPLGVLTGAFLFVYFAGYAFVEHFKEPEAGLVMFGLTLAQALSIAPVLAGVFILARAWRAPRPSGWLPG